VNRKPTPFRRPRGFTMIELVVVMAVIGLLLSIAVPRYMASLDRGKIQVQQQNLAIMREAIDKFYGDNGRYPDTLEDLVTKRYLRAIPIDPISEAPDWITVPPSDSKLQGRVYDVQSARPGEHTRENAPVSEVSGPGSIQIEVGEGAASEPQR
jgi:general secretion pathway protein G